MIIKKTMGILSLLLVVSLGNASDTSPEISPEISLGIEDAVTQSLEYNFDIKKEQYNMKKLHISRAASWSSVIPTVSASSTLTRLNIEPSAISGINQSRLNAGLSVETPLAGGLVGKIIDVIIPYKEYNAGESSLNTLLASVSVSVQKSYLDLYISQETLDFLEEKLAIDKQKNDEARIAYQAGLLDEYNYLLSEYAAIQSQLAVSTQSDLHKQLEENLAILIGYPIDSTFNLTDEIEDVDRKDAEKWVSLKGLEENGTIQQLLFQEEVAKLNELKGIFAILPSFTLGWTSSYDFLDDPIVDGSSWVDTGNWSDDVGALQLRLFVPLGEYLPWSRSVVGLRQYRQDVKSTEVTIEQARSSTKQQLQSRQRSLTEALDSLDAQQYQIEIAKRAFELSDNAYKDGLQDITQFQESENNLYNAQVNYLINKANIIKNILDIEVLVGKLDPGFKN